MPTNPRFKKNRFLLIACLLAGSVAAVLAADPLRIVFPDDEAVLNAEGTKDGGLIRNEGGKLWVMGSKSKGRGVCFLTSKGGVTEIYGAYEYATHPIDPEDRLPMFWSQNSTMFVSGIMDVCFTGKPYNVKFRDDRGEEQRELDRKEIGRRKIIWTSFATRPGKKEAGE